MRPFHTVKTLNIHFYFTVPILSAVYSLSASRCRLYVNCFTFRVPLSVCILCLSALSDWLPLSLDDKTAQKLLWISEGGTKVARTSDAVCPYPNRPERYEHSPQVGPAVVSLGSDHTCSVVFIIFIIFGLFWITLSNYNQTNTPVTWTHLLLGNWTENISSYQL